MSDQNGAKSIPVDAPALDPAAWLKKKADNVIDDVLPSGLAVKRKRQVSLESLATSGKLPLTLLTELEGLGEAEEGEIELDLADIMTNIERYMGLVDAIFIAAMVSPKIGEATNLDEDTLALVEFEDEAADKIYILGEVMEATDALRPFRSGQDTDGASSLSEQPIPSTAVEPAGNSG